MRLSKEEVRHIALLARLGVTQADVERFREQLSNILENFQVLQQVNTTDVPPTAQSITLGSVMRGDMVRPSYSQEEILANAPRQEEGSFRVRAVLE